MSREAALTSHRKLGTKSKNPPKIGLKKTRENDWPYLILSSSNSLTRFFKTNYAITGKGNHVNILKFSRKNIAKSDQVNLFLADFKHLKSLCTETVLAKLRRRTSTSTGNSLLHKKARHSFLLLAGHGCLVAQRDKYLSFFCQIIVCDVRND